MDLSEIQKGINEKAKGQRKKAIVVKYTCESCPNQIYESEDCRWCLLTRKPIDTYHIPDWCPLDDLMIVIKIETNCLD